MLIIAAIYYKFKPIIEESWNFISDSIRLNRYSF
jgi:hypothetical protein